MIGQKSWNKLFEQNYLPYLLEKDNASDPITGISMHYIFKEENIIHNI